MATPLKSRKHEAFRTFGKGRSNVSVFDVRFRARVCLGASHVGAGPRVDLDCLAFLDEEGNIDRFASL
jgi:hypothetical protein